jgi:peptidyl-prolyl cis-trans isomerase SurA
MMRMTRLALILCAALIAVTGLGGWISNAKAETVIVVVNDQPITPFDVTRRIKMENILDGGASGELSKQQALKELINDVLKEGELKRFKAMPSEKEVDDTVNRIAKGMNLDAAGLAAEFRRQGIEMKTVRRKLAISIGFNRVLNSRYRVRTDVTEAEVSRRLEQIAKDPRLKPRTIYKLLDVILPVEQAGAMTDQLLMARAVEAQQVMARYQGCNTARKAAQGIFNVKIGKVFEADPERLPPELKTAIDKAGTTKLVGPIRSNQGIQLLGFCGKTSIAPKPPSREQIRSYLINERYGAYTERYMRDLRRTAFIDYKDKSYQPK